MRKLARLIKPILPPTVFNFLRWAHYKVCHTANKYPGWYLPWIRMEQRRRLAPFRNRHKGERCFIIGNGPSLKQTDLTLLKSEVTFGLNRIYLNFDRMGYETSYYVCVNSLVLEQTGHEISEISCPKFVSWAAGRRYLPKNQRSYVFLRTKGPAELGFNGNLNEEISEGATVTFVAMQLAFFMGFREVILVGVDHSFATKGKAHEIVTTEDSDPNHFDANYFGKGFRWQLPDLKASELAYSTAKSAFETAGGRIRDATVGGALQIFEKANLEQILAE